MVVTSGPGRSVTGRDSPGIRLGGIPSADRPLVRLPKSYGRFAQAGEQAPGIIPSSVLCDKSNR